MATEQKIKWNQLPWYLKVAVIVSLIDAVIYIVTFGFGFIEGMLAI